MKQIDSHGVYNRLKVNLMTCEFPLGKQLRLEPLADQFGVSITPIREALIRLAAERLVDEIPNAGFFTKRISESDIRDLYMATKEICDISLKKIKKKSRKSKIAKLPPSQAHNNNLLQSNHVTSEELVQAYGNLFIQISSRSGSDEIINIIRNINDRIHYFRLLECQLLEDTDKTFIQLYQLYLDGNIGDLGHELEVYFKTRTDLIPDLIDLIRQK